MEQQCESLAYEIELKNEKISKLQTSLNEKTLQLEKEQGKKLLWVSNLRVVCCKGETINYLATILVIHFDIKI